MAYDNTNTGMISRNPDKDSADANPKWPDFKGFINVDGVEYWVSGWKKTAGENAKNPGKPFMSLRIEPKQAPKQAPKKNDTTDGFIDDDIPF